MVIPQKPKKAMYPHVLREGGIGTMSGLIKWFVSTPLYLLFSTDISWSIFDAITEELQQTPQVSAQNLL